MTDLEQKKKVKEFLFVMGRQISSLRNETCWGSHYK